MAPSPSAASYSLPAKYGGEVTTRATQPSGRSSARASAQRERLADVDRPGERVVAGDLGGPEPGVELGGVVALPTAHAEPARGRTPPRRCGPHRPRNYTAVRLGRCLSGWVSTCRSGGDHPFYSWMFAGHAAFAAAARAGYPGFTGGSPLERALLRTRARGGAGCRVGPAAGPRGPSRSSRRPAVAGGGAKVEARPFRPVRVEAERQLRAPAASGDGFGREGGGDVVPVGDRRVAGVLLFLSGLGPSCPCRPCRSGGGAAWCSGCGGSR